MNVTHEKDLLSHQHNVKTFHDLSSAAKTSSCGLIKWLVHDCKWKKDRVAKRLGITSSVVYGALRKGSLSNIDIISKIVDLKPAVELEAIIESEKHDEGKH